MPRTCSVQSCTAAVKQKFKFPEARPNRERLLKWLEASGNVSLLKFSLKQLRTKGICVVHFEPKYILAKKLSNNAVPTLHLPEKIDASAYFDGENVENEPPNKLAKYETACLLRQKSVPQEVIIHSESGCAENCLQASDFTRTNDTAKSKQLDQTVQQSESGMILSDDSGHGTKICESIAVQETTVEHMEKEGNDMEHAAVTVEENVQIKGTPLSLFNLSRKSQLTMKEKKLYNVIAQLRKTARESQKHKVSLRSRLKTAEKLVSDGMFDSIADLPETSRNFLQSYFRNLKRSKYHRQYTIKDKVFALALYKRSSRAYRFLQDIFSLPSVENLRTFAHRVGIQPGLCPFIFKSLSEKIKRLGDDKAKYCILAFDETSLDPMLNYNSRTGTVEGFVDSGCRREPQIANHVMVWMLKGIQGTWKQPIMYSFCNSTEKWEDIVRTFKDIVREANKYGLKIVSSICDQGATNVRAIKYLIESGKRESFQNGTIARHENIVIDGQVIVPLFDPPHLMKCVRNNLLTKDVKFKLRDGIERVAKWSHIVTAYEIDKSTASLRTMSKLTDQHVYVDKMKKMKVKYCTQLFSNNVASVMSLMSRSRAKSVDGNQIMPADGDDTARFLQFMNNLFDSVNGDAKKQKLTSTEACDDEWNEYMDVLRTMTYVKSKPGDQEKPIVLKNWVITLQGFKYLKTYLKELGFERFCTRIFNQDAVENFFGQIKQHGIRDTRPSCSKFTSHYKTLLLKNFSQKNTSFNCESDEGSSFLVDLENIITAVVPSKHVELPTILKGLPISNYKTFEVDFHAFLQNIRGSMKKCKTCENNVSPVSECFVQGFNEMTGLMPYYISRFIHVERFGKLIIEQLKNKRIFEFERCDHTEELLELVIAKCVEKTITQYLKQINRVLSLSASPHENVQDAIMLQAQKMYQNRSRRRAAEPEQ